VIDDAAGWPAGPGSRALPDQIRVPLKKIQEIGQNGILVRDSTPGRGRDRDVACPSSSPFGQGANLSVPAEPYHVGGEIRGRIDLIRKWHYSNQSSEGMARDHRRVGRSVPRLRGQFHFGWAKRSHCD